MHLRVLNFKTSIKLRINTEKAQDNKIQSDSMVKIKH